jgi:hypothetical protein
MTRHPMTQLGYRCTVSDWRLSVKSFRIASLALALAALAALPGRPGEACGDKFVRVGRGGRFQRGYVAVHPSSILVFVNGRSADAATMKKLPATLKAAGHKARAVSTPIAFAEALKAQRYDLVMAEAADLHALSAAMAGITPAPHVLTVVATPAKYRILVDIDEAMAASRN